MSRALRAALFLALGLSTLAACTRATTDAGSGPPPGGNAFTHHHELRIVDIADIDTLDPMLSSQLTTHWLSQMTMAYLVRYDRRNQPVPELATVVPSKANGGISADGKTITYHLRAGVRWSDGVPFDASDVVWTTSVVNDPKTNIDSRDGWDRIVAVAAPNAHTVIFHLKEPYSPFIGTVFSTGGANPAILPKHLLEHTPDINKDPYNALPVGIGPFKYVAWKRGDRVEMVANDRYWRGRPKLDRVTYIITPSRDTIMNELQTGAADLWPIAAPAYIKRIGALPGFTLLRQPGFSFGHIDFNTSHPVVADPRVRRALLLAYDRREQRDKISHGVGTLQDGVLSPLHPLFDPKIGFTERNVAAANALLDRAGWRRGPDGVRIKDGVRLSLDLVSNIGSPDTDARIELLRENWREIGVTFVRKNYDVNRLLAPVQSGGVVFSGHFDAVFFAWFPSVTGDLSNLYGCAFIPPAGQNDPRWCNRRADLAMQDLKTTYDTARQKRDDAIVQEEMVKDTPVMVSAIAEDLYVENDDLKNFHPNNVSEFDDMMSVDL